ncbi:MAG: TonB-dependent receptor [Saprospiraceae bacterium]|nr:TonB-dependent receptor [Saprospiraceae bacterium]
MYEFYNKRIIVNTVLIFGLVLSMQAQIITVKDKDSQKPLEEVSFFSESPYAFAVSNNSGQLDISAFKGADSISIFLMGFRTIYRTYQELVSSDFEVLLERSSIKINEIVVSASRTAQRSGNIPSRITSISSADVSLQNPQTAADLLSISGEVFIQKSQQGGGSPMIRGFSANRLLYTVDGVRMNSAIFRSGNLQNVISLDPFAIQNTEVLFGPGSIIYGSDAIGGVMSFQTLRPKLSLSEKVTVSGNANVRYSTANQEKTGHADFNIGWQKWSLLSSVTFTEFGDLRMGTRGPNEYLRNFYVEQINNEDKLVINSDPLIQRPTGYNQINLMQKIRFRPNDKWEFLYDYHLSETSEYSRYDRLIEVLPNETPRSAVWNYGPQKWTMHNFTGHHTGNAKFYDRITFRLAVQGFEESRIDRNFTGGQRFRLRTNLEQVNAYSVNVDFEKHSMNHKFYYGAEYIKNDVKSVGSAIDIRNENPIAVPDRYPGSTWNSYAAYLSYQYELSDKISLQAGARYNSFDISSDFTRHLEFFPFDFTKSQIHNSSTTGSLGLVYRPDESWKIGLNSGTGFRAPNVDDIGKIFDFAAGEVVVPNTSLKAEYAYNCELNISKTFGESVKIDATGFYTFLDNAMVRREFQVNGQDSILYTGQLSKVYSIQNAAYADVYGFNLGVEVKLMKGLKFTSSYNYQLGKEETDNGLVNRSRHAAPAFGVTRLIYNYHNLSVQFYSMFSAEVSHANLNEEEKQKPAIYAKDGDGNPYSPSWHTLNLKAMYEISQVFKINCGLENITDQRYRPYSSGIVAPGRNFIISLHVRF